MSCALVGRNKDNLSPLGVDTADGGQHQPGGGSSPEPDPAATFISDFPAPKLGEINFCCLSCPTPTPPRLRYLVSAESRQSAITNQASKRSGVKDAGGTEPANSKEQSSDTGERGPSGGDPPAFLPGH